MSAASAPGSGKLALPLGNQRVPPSAPPSSNSPLRNVTFNNADELHSENRLLAVDGDADKLRELEIREDIMKRVQRLQLRSSVGRSTDVKPSTVKMEALGKPARGEMELIPWDADVEEGELACTIS